MKFLMTEQMMNLRHSGSERSTGFDRLADPVRRWIWNKGWNKLRDIQERSIPTLLNGDEDVIIAAATAGGKTEAAFLPLISLILEHPGESGFDLVYVGPLRALINDQFERLEDLCDRAELPVHPWHGDISQGVKARARKNPRGVLLITPESLEALFVLRGLEIPTLFKSTRAVVIDELHALLDTERGVHLRSLLTRMELAVGHRIRRIGLSATLGEMVLAREYLRPEAPETVTLLKSESDNQELKVQIRGYLRRRDRSESKSNEDDEDETAAERAIASHVFSRLRGSRNLIFAGARQNVEWYADALRQMSEEACLPVEFFPHHASLSREHRMDLEKRLKTHPATTAVCTSTLELGIDIGDIACVAQIGAPFSVASLRQRLGRSGRRTGQSAVLRMYAIETEPGTDAHPLDRLHLGLVRSIAMVELLIEGWCEPPVPQALRLSTLTHQILSVITEHGGVSAKRLYATLCEHGPFRRVSPRLFARLLKQLGKPDVALIEQAPDGALLLGRQGERLIEHYSFYAVFQTPEEYRIIADGKPLGTLPVIMILTPNMTIIFSGRRWRITEIHDKDKVIEVTADQVGRPPNFGGDSGLIHDRVMEKMRDVLSGADLPIYIDESAARLLEDARAEFRRLDIVRKPICGLGKRSCLIATWRGTVKTSTLALALQAMGYKAETYDGFLNIDCKDDAGPVEVALKEIARSDPISADSVLSIQGNFMTEKFHPYLSPDLLIEDVTSSRIDLVTLPELARSIIENGE
ncbi:MAG: DEAD/DEAH box helicase [Thiotrichales bacterium]|nr:DEAD/DEAH box helicase [Thiotrichales bacterium]